jgi:protocatechuate 4,5-dioxygenase alpha chain
MSQIDRSRPIPDTVIFDGRQSRRGYRLNRFCLTLTKPENRAAMKEDADGYMAECGLTEAEQDLVRGRDYLGMIEAGGNIYLIMKLGAVNGDGLYQMGAQQRGQTYEEFLATRQASGAR